MGLTYDGGANLLKYIYNSDDELGVEKNGVPALYNNFTIELRKSDGSPYEGVTVALPRGSQSIGEPVWNINGNIVTNASDLTFSPKATSGSDTINTFNVYLTTLANQSILFATGTLNTPITVQQGETPIIRAYDSNSGDGLEINIDQTNKYTSAFKEKIYNYLFLAEDSFSGIAEYKFVIYNTSGNSTPLEFYLTRDSGLPNFNITSEAGGSYAAARNASDVVLPLNQGSNISTDEIRMFYSQGTFPNYTYLEAGDFIMREIGTGTPITYTIANGETARLQTNFLRINAR